MALAWKTGPTEEAPAVQPPRGLVNLFYALTTHFGHGSVDFAPGLTRSAGGNYTLEVRVDPEHFDEALDVVSELSLQAEREYGEPYSVIVIPKA